ncbi:uncharacterized protein CCOS01_02088 [Colletotrichum costaricense]|uniref:Uncharacterized protein n=1 Tax=Colletotrichum costaricense TaxID=1209916 RepID=A0AAJ0E659_9PEZI|nr:uncharacterized protein CCOS01_02088 [Colletotrichum costaricense]KAK1536768.1 hypothetical protein CCOS01_02088 [Colletotrichum costaricense]
MDHPFPRPFLPVSSGCFCLGFSFRHTRGNKSPTTRPGSNSDSIPDRPGNGLVAPFVSNRNVKYFFSHLVRASPAGIPFADSGRAYPCLVLFVKRSGRSWLEKRGHTGKISNVRRTKEGREVYPSLPTLQGCISYSEWLIIDLWREIINVDPLVSYTTNCRFVYNMVFLSSNILAQLVVVNGAQALGTSLLLSGTSYLVQLENSRRGKRETSRVAGWSPLGEEGRNWCPIRRYAGFDLMCANQPTAL